MKVNVGLEHVALDDIVLIHKSSKEMNTMFEIVANTVKR